MKFKSLLTGVLLAFGLGTAATAADVKVGFVYVGPRLSRPTLAGDSSTLIAYSSERFSQIQEI